MTLCAYLDCFAGLSGDMLLGALLDAGWPVERLQDCIGRLRLEGVQATVEPVTKQGIHGLQVTITSPSDEPQRGYAELAAIVQGAELPPDVQQKALSTLRLLGEAESAVHHVPFEQVHFHEIGAVDTLVDVVGTCLGLHDLKISAVHCAPIPWSHGTIRTAHGVLPVPPPAVVALLRDVPIVDVNIQGEMVTPTGAALVRTLASSFGPIPAMTISRVGYGAGRREWPDRPNLLRLVIGEVVGSQLQIETLRVIACNIDDMTPQWYGPLMEKLLEAQALDVWLTPVQMKKNRPGTVIEVLCRAPQAEAVRVLLLRHSTTLGVREYAVSRYSLERYIETVETPFGSVRVKVAKLPGGGSKAAPEHDDCVARASEHQVSVREVWLAAMQAAGSPE